MNTTHRLPTTDARLFAGGHRRDEVRRGGLRLWARTNGWKVRPTNPLDTPTRRALATALPTPR